MHLDEERIHSQANLSLAYTYYSRQVSRLANTSAVDIAHVDPVR